jgi:outer membrane beta-barrel protein
MALRNRRATGAASIAALLALTALLGVSQAQAQTKPNPEDDISVVQRKPFLSGGRAELAPHIGLTINDSLIRQFEVGAALMYHLNESFWFGGKFGWFELGELGGVTDQYFEVLDKANSIPDIVELKWYGGAQFGWVPTYGKFAMFDSAVVFYDVSLYLGGGLTNHTTSQGEAGAPTGEIGIMPRVFLNHWLSLHLALQDRILPTTLTSGSSLTHVVSAQLGVSVFMPFGFEYTTAR